jgi:hypothetical protein
MFRNYADEISAPLWKGSTKIDPTAGGV